MRLKCLWVESTRLLGTQDNGGTSAHQPSGSSDSSSTHNFRGDDRECKQRLCLSRRSRIHPKLSILLEVDLFNFKRTVEG